MRSRHPEWLSAQESIVKPAAFSAQIDAADAILCFSEGIFSRLIGAFDLRAGEAAPRLPGSLEGRLDETVVIYRGSFGGPAAGALMETLIASGVERLVMVGQAGAISPQCQIGDLVLPTWGVREEGTSYHYLASDVPCQVSQDLLSALKGYLASVEVRKGGVWTTDALFRETLDKAQRLADQGVLAVEMECTTLMAIAMIRRVHFAAVLIITDQLFSGEWVQGFRRAEVIHSQDLLCRALADGFRHRGSFAPLQIDRT